MNIGAHYHRAGRCEFHVWAPFVKDLAVKIQSPQERIVKMTKDDEGYWSVIVDGLLPHSTYVFHSSQFGDKPDPASFFQPQGVHGPSQIVDHKDYAWGDDSWSNLELSEMIIYELHVGTFSPEGTFEAIIPCLDELKELGINAIELMPVAQFPGERNWGYDGVDLFAVQNSYGGPHALKKLVDHCHQKGMAVILDVVYNHIGPEGNYLGSYGPYCTQKYHTPWGYAINFDDAFSDDVRHFFIQNALYWFEYFHIDALRLDAVHAIYDMSARPFLSELAEKVDEWSKRNNRKVYLIAESDLNEIKIVQKKEAGGYGLHAQWSDDFHHSVHALLTKEDNGYYQDFGQIDHLAKALKESFVYSWQYSKYRKRYHGSCAAEIPAGQFIVSIQNHDQVGNRKRGERLAQLVSFEALKLAAGVLFFSPYIPLIFMGEEYAEDTPFCYFISHADPGLIQAVRDGRNREFASFRWPGEHFDPDDQQTFLNSKIKREKRHEGKYKAITDFYKELMVMRKKIPALKNLERKNMEVISQEEENILYFRRWQENHQVVVLTNFSDDQQSFKIQLPQGQWKKLIDSFEQRWHGPGVLLKEQIVSGQSISIGPWNFAAYQMES